MFSLSFTKIEKFRRCPFEYRCYTNYDLNKKYHKDTPPLIFGSIMHGILNDYYKNLEKEERTIKKLIELFKQKYNASKDKHDRVFGNKETLAKFAKMARREFEHFLASPLSQQTPFVATEENIKTDLGGVELLSKIDRIDSSKNGLKIIDYKTGRFIEDQPDSLQLDLYALSAFLKFPEIPIDKKIYYYLHDNRLIEVDYTNGEIRKTRDLVLKTAEKIQECKEFKPIRNQKCQWCDFIEICPLFEGDDRLEMK
jgi:RecB family exonuclease